MIEQLRKESESTTLRPKVLLVEDDQDLQDILKSILEKEGLQVNTANSGAYAKKAIGLNNFSAVITDIKMPGEVDGLQLLAHVTNTRPNLPVVVITGAPFDAIEAMALGAKAFLPKPFNSRELIQALKRDCNLDARKTPSSKELVQKMKSCVRELDEFLCVAEEVLEEIDSNRPNARDQLLVFYEPMRLIRKEADDAGLEEIAEIARLGQEVSRHAVHAELRCQVRKSAAGLWDAVTTLRYLLKTGEFEMTDVQAILMNRLRVTLQVTLKDVGGAPAALGAEDKKVFLEVNE